jgi:creatinine amidohydrolase
MSGMKALSRYWAELNTQDFARLDPQRAVAVLPLGATEQHGPHLSLNVDTQLVDGVVQAALPHLTAEDQVLVLPTQALGLSTEHQAFAGTLTLSPETLLRVWCDIGEAVARAGLRKLVLFNAHGGNVAPMDIVARELRGRCNMLVPAAFGVHGGDQETSMMLALHPQGVDMTQAENFPSTSEQRAAEFDVLGNGKSAKMGWHMQDYNAKGAAGNAAAATAAKGQALVASAGLQLAKLLQEVGRLPLTTLR